MNALLLAIALGTSPVAPGETADSPTVPPVGAPAPVPKGPDVSKMPFNQFSIREVVKAHLPDVQSCYERVITEKGTREAPQGRVMAKFSILPTGLVGNPGVDEKQSTLKDAAVHQCVTDELKSWAFPKPNDGLEHPILYPLDLKVDVPPPAPKPAEPPKAAAPAAEPPKAEPAKVEPAPAKRPAKGEKKR